MSYVTIAMNIFYLHESLPTCARYHVDGHVVKMILESAQMLCTAINLTGGESPYQSVHQNHPCTVWARTSLSNWRWLRDLTIELNKEFIFRYSGKDHASYRVVMGLSEPPIEDLGITERPQCVHDAFKRDDPILAYRLYYVRSKQHLHKWTKRKIPPFMRELKYAT